MIPFHIATPQSCDIKMFYRNGVWIKPAGVSQIYMLLIGGGGNGNGSTSGGGSGAVTKWWGAAQHVPDSLVISVSTGNASNTTISYRGTNGLNVILTASGGNGTSGGGATGSGAFNVSGFYTSIAGQSGAIANISASTTTFLSGGADDGTVNTVTANYGYGTAINANGVFMLQPIIVGAGGSGAGKGDIGCGGGRSGVGGPGLVLIAAW